MILHVITSFASHGGAQTMLARLLAQSREPALVVPLTEASPRNIALADNPRVSYAPLGARSALAMPGAAWQLAQLIRRRRPRAILCWMYHAMAIGALAARLAGSRVPLYWTVRQALDDPAALSRSTRAAVRLSRRLSGQAAGIIYNSQRALEQHGAYGFAPARALMIPNGFALPSAQPQPGPARVFGIAARLHPQKDHGCFFAAAALALQRCPELRFAAAGEDVEAGNPQIRHLLAQSGLPPERIELCGELADMEGFYRRIGALVLSSRTEGFPNVLAEAMSHCRPVITTDTGDAAAVAGPSGLVVPPRDPAALAAAMTEMAGWSPERYAAAAQKARARVEERYALPAIAAAFDAVLNGEALPCAV